MRKPPRRINRRRHRCRKDREAKTGFRVISRPRQSRFQQPFVAHAFRAAKAGEGLGMEVQKGLLLDPDGLHHFARAANTSR